MRATFAGVFGLYIPAMAGRRGQAEEEYKEDGRGDTLSVLAAQVVVL
jgi:hypothetical protein